MNFNFNDIIVDFYSTFGKKFVLTNVIPKPVYRDGNKTDEVIYNYDICCIDRKMKHIYVKIAGKQLLPTPEDGNITIVELIEPVARPYMMNNQLGFSVIATDIKAVKE